MPLLALIVAALSLSAEGEVRGEFTYARHGVILDGELVRWRRLATLEHVQPTPEAALAAFESRLADASGSEKKLVELAHHEQAFVREHLARRAWKTLLERDANHVGARAGLSFTRLDDVWTPALDLLPERQAAAKSFARQLRLADWLWEHRLVEQYSVLVMGLIVADAGGSNKRISTRELVPHAKRLGMRWLTRTRLSPPFAGRWHAAVDKTGHHQKKAWGQYAIDYVRPDATGLWFAGNGKKLEQHHAFGQPIHAAADGVVFLAEGRFDDLPPGTVSGCGEANQVMIRHEHDEYTTYGHLLKGSVTVQPGDTVRRGQLLGRVGNSGRSGIPHLHFALSVALRQGSGSAWLCVPHYFDDCQLVTVHDEKCAIHIIRAQMQEGWTIVCKSPDTLEQEP